MSATSSIGDQRMDAQLADWLREGPDQGSALGLERVLTATHALVTTRRVVGAPGLPASDPRAALLEFLAVRRSQVESS